MARCLVRRVLTLLALLALGSLASAPGLAWDAAQFKDEDGNDPTSHPDWMAWLPDDVSLADISLPGTHDTATEGGSVFSRTQGYTLAEQLQTGIRLLDIRCKNIQDVFTLHHGAEYLGINFGGGAVEPCRDFLLAHPTETIVMRVKKEQDDEDSTRPFYETFAWYRDVVYPGVFWDPGDLFSTHPVPTLGQVRGKIVVLQDFSAFGRHYGLDWDVDPPFRIQDEYDVWDFPCFGNYCKDDKWDDVRAHFDEADGADASTIYVNFLSGSTHIAPGTLAAYVNPRALEYLLEGNVTNKAGWVMMDFPGAALTSAIIACNFRHASPGADLQTTFSRVYADIVESTDGDAEGRYDDIAPYVRHTLPGRLWHVFVLKPGWAYSVQTDGLVAAEDAGDFRLVSFTSRDANSRYSLAQIKAFVDAQLPGLSGSTGERRTALASAGRAQFPHQLWGIIVKKAPGGFENWAYSLFGTVYDTGQFVDEHRYVVWAYSLQNTPPVADAGPDQRFECSGQPIQVTLDGTGSTDVEGDPLTWLWTGPFAGGVATGPNPTVVFPPGPAAHLVTLVVHDGYEASTPATMTVTVEDTTPPVVLVARGRDVLWPATGGLIDVAARVSADDLCAGPLPVTVSVYSDEPEGAPPYAPDAVAVAGVLRLRAERQVHAAAHGRVYLVVARSVDPSGNAGHAATAVIVPKVFTVAGITALRAKAEAALAAFGAGGVVPAGFETMLAPTPFP